MHIEKLKKKAEKILKVLKVLEEIKDCEEVNIGYDFDGDGSGWIEIDNVTFEFNGNKEIEKTIVTL